MITLKKHAQSFVVSLIAFLAVAFFYPGFSYNENFAVLGLAALAFAVLTVFIKPIIKLLSLPFNLLTFGLFSFLINVIVLYGVSYLVADFRINSFYFPGYNLSGFIVPAADLNQLLSALVASLLIGVISTVLHWIFR